MKDKYHKTINGKIVAINLSPAGLDGKLAKFEKRITTIEQDKFAKEMNKLFNGLCGRG